MLLREPRDLERFRDQASSLFLALVGIVGIVGFIYFIKVDIDASITPLEPYVGFYMALAMSIAAGSAFQIVLMYNIAVAGGRAKRGREWWLLAALLVVDYAYDITTNILHFYSLGMASQPRWEGWGDAVVIFSGTFLAFAEYGLGLCFQLAWIKLREVGVIQWRESPKKVFQAGPSKQGSQAGSPKQHQPGGRPPSGPPVVPQTPGQTKAHEVTKPPLKVRTFDED